ncbi:MAG: tripartite tricarboxylate transporter substrate binding protein [Alphaproteobacteria bacterium]|nr:tripartite tricarboxylate transporter substrate binding protein [Alphaproteobacteria bacterium]
MASRDRVRLLATIALCLAGLVSAATAVRAAWQPSQPITFVVPAGKGGGADQMARQIAEITAKNKLEPQPIDVVNEGAGAGAQGFLDVKGDSGDASKIVITLSNLFTTPLSTGVPFEWSDFTPVAMLALDEFVLWVNADTPYKTAADYIAAVKAAPGKFKMGGTGAKQEDQIVTAAIEQKTGGKFTYVPLGGGGSVAQDLIDKKIDSTVNNPIEALEGWRAGKLRPLCVFDAKRMAYADKVAGGMAWQDIPTCREAGLDVRYLMMRGIFMPPGVEGEAVEWYIQFLGKLRTTPEWQAFMKEGAYDTTFLTGEDFATWLRQAAAEHKQLMEQAGFLAHR